MVHVRDAGHSDLQRHRHLLFHLFGCAARPLRDYLNVVIGDVRIRFHGQIVKRDGAPDEQQKSGGDNQQTIIKGEVDEDTNHASFIVSSQPGYAASAGHAAIAASRLVSE